MVPSAARASESAMRLPLREQTGGLDGDDPDDHHEQQQRLVVLEPIRPDHILHDADHETADDDTTQAAEAPEDRGVETAQHDEEAEVEIDRGTDARDEHTGQTGERAG